MVQSAKRNASRPILSCRPIQNNAAIHSERETKYSQTTLDPFSKEIEEQLAQNPLLQGILQVLKQVASFKETARDYYFEVLLSIHACPKCGGRMKMTGPSQCTCACGAILDPTLAFQTSECCGAQLKKKICHYACSACGQTTPSKFLFDERLFDPEYFRQRMAESRENKRIKREQIRRLLEGSQSGPLSLSSMPELEAIPGLAMSLDDFIGSVSPGDAWEFEIKQEFRMEEYRQAILALIQEHTIHFDAIHALCENRRKDRVRRFITLIFMDHEQEISLLQQGKDIWVMRHEAHAEG